MIPGPLTDPPSWDTVRALTEENRLCRSAARERDLVRLRHRLFRQTEISATPTVWPPVWPDPWPGLERRPPEIGPAELTLETLGGGIVNHGCVLVRGLIPTLDAERLAACVDAAYAARDVFVEGAPMDEEGWYVPFEDPVTGAHLPEAARHWYQEGGGLLAVDSPRSFFAVHEMLDRTGIPSLIERYMGERPSLSIDKLTLRRIRGSHPTWHQDGGFMGNDLRTVNLWLSLSYCGGDSDTVGLDIIPKRFHEVLPTGTHGATFPGMVGPELVELVTRDAPILTPAFAPGDALLFDDLFLHRTSVRPGLVKDRRALEAWFFASSRFPQAYTPVAV